MNIVIRENVNIVSHWLVYIIAWIVLFFSFKKTRLFLLMLFGLKSFQFVFFSTLMYILLVLNNKTFLNTYSKYVLHNYLNTTIDIYKDKPCIYVTNYPVPFFNYLIVSIFPEKTVFIGHCGKFFGANLISKYSYKLKGKNNFKSLKNKINTFVKKEQKSVVLFIEEVHLDKKSIHKLSRLKTGIFEIAKSLHIPIVPVGIQPINTVVGLPSNYNHKIISDKPFIVNDIDESKLKVKNFLKKFLRNYT